MSFARMNRPDDSQQFIFRHTLKDVARGSRSQRPLDVAIAVRSGQHDYASMGKLSSNCYQGVCAIGTRKAEVHQGDVGPMTTKFSYRLDRIGGLRNQNHVLLRSDDRAQSFTENWMVLNT